MKKLTTLMLFFFAAFAVNAQTTTTGGSLVRHFRHLRFENENNNISKETLQLILNEQDFEKYKLARREYVASIPLWSLSAVGLTASAAFLGFGLYDMFSPSSNNPDFPTSPVFPYMFMISGALCGITLLPFIPAIVLTIDSRVKLNKICKNHNHKLSISFGTAPQEYGISLNF